MSKKIALPDLWLTLKRMPFTEAMLLMLSLVAWLTGTHVGQLSGSWLSRLGFAPRDLVLLNWERVLTSALVTSGGKVFWEALGMIALATGASEWLTGTKRAAITFWGVHFATLLTISLLLAYPLHWAGASIGSALIMARDVGPSAGYFGSLGLVASRLQGRWQGVFFGLVWAGLLLVLFASLVTGVDAIATMSANLAHVVAFPLGMLSGIYSKRASRH